MIRINSFLHRESLKEITYRWFYGDLKKHDIPTLKALINFNSIWMRRVSEDFAGWLFSSFRGGDIGNQLVTRKGDLKDFLVKNPPYTTRRTKVLIRRYLEHPERYFRETPFMGVLFHKQASNGTSYIGSTRIKRIRRIAEKGARRVSDFLFKEIKKGADQLAQQRADTLGISKSELITSPMDMTDEFERAEHRIEQAIRRGQLFQNSLEFILDDVFGAKVIAEEEEQPKVIALLDKNPLCEILEIEQHRGRYNGTNVVFRYFPDKKKLLSKPLSTQTIQRLDDCGMDPARVEQDFHEFVLSGEDSLFIELIVNSYQELLESEIGKSQHEDRIMRQRLAETYRGHLARNVSYLMEFIFACGISPRTTIEEIPIQVWNRYMPDYFDEVIKDLFQIPSFRVIE